MDIWEIIILRPMINVLIVVSKYLFNSPGMAIIVFTIIIRGADVPAYQETASFEQKNAGSAAQNSGTAEKVRQR